MEGRDFEEVARISSFDQLTKAVLKWLFDRVFQNDLDQWCKMNRQLESQEVAVHSNKVLIIKETFLANGHVDKTDLPPLEVMFERAIAAEKLLQQLHHGTLMRTANSARYADRRDDPHVMAVLREPPPTLGVQLISSATATHPARSRHPTQPRVPHHSRRVLGVSHCRCRRGVGTLHVDARQPVARKRV